jgi:hypothetical protein
MKKTIIRYSLALLLFTPLGFGSLSAQTQTNITVRPITANYTASPPTVTFEVSWPAGSRNTTYHQHRFSCIISTLNMILAIEI